MRKTYFLSVILFFGLLTAVCMLGGGLQYFLDIPSLIFVVFFPLFLVIANFSFKEIFTSFQIGFRQDASIMELKKALVFFRSLRLYLIFTGILGFVIGFIQILIMIPDYSKIGPAMAVAILTFLYSIIFIAIFALPFKYGILKRLAERE